MLALTTSMASYISSVLNSDRAVQMNILIIRAFVRLREVLASHEAMGRKMQQLEAMQKDHASLFAIVFQDFERLKKHVTHEINKLKAPRRRKPLIGFYTDQK